jgi:hypothetical protein
MLDASSQRHPGARGRDAMTRFAQIEYRNEPGKPTNITLHVNTCARVDGGWRVHSVEQFPGITSKPAAMALARQLGASLA